MRKLGTWAGGLLLMAGAMGAASAQTASPATGPLSTATLANLCAAAPDGEGAMAVGYCRGFIIGAWQYHTEITRPGGAPAVFCLPDPAPTLDAAQSAFVAWVAANPGYGNDKAIDGLMRWAASAYPCPTSAPARGSRR
ncbi:Rap1a/Tai family immunity protein [Roseococcus sp. YIM B11640]|uniref:Rap1a/Tai family immunity protein n=1 Tax=Roseococcus sp. YIM B11640 TaxID=3133973 RepID=UPI003C7B0C9F